MSVNYEQPSSQLYESHFKSLLDFQLDNLDFLELLDDTFDYKKYYQSVLDYVDENGVKTYGVVVTGSPEEILKFCEEENVCKIYINNVDFNLG